MRAPVTPYTLTPKLVAMLLVMVAVGLAIGCVLIFVWNAYQNDPVSLFIAGGAVIVGCIACIRYTEPVVERWF